MLRRTVGSCAPWWRLCRSKRGVLLVDYVMSVAVGAMLAALVCAGLGRTAISWQRLLGQLELAGRRLDPGHKFCACIPFSCNGVDEKYLFHRGAPSAQ